MRGGWLALASALSLQISACTDDGASSRRSAASARARAAAEPAPTPEPPPPEPPRFLLLPWDTKLHVAPETYAPALNLSPHNKDPMPGGDHIDVRGRVIAVVGKADAAGRWWKLETGSLQHADVAGRPIEGLDVYALSLYVPAGTGTAVTDPAEPTSEDILRVLGSVPTVEPRTQSGLTRPAGLTQEWRVPADAKVYWPNGALAGRVVETHAFVREPKRERERDCFAIRIGPPVEPVTSLCFEPAAVVVSAPPLPDHPSLDMVVDADDLWGGLIGVPGDDESLAELFGRVELDEVEGEEPMLPHIVEDPQPSHESSFEPRE